jgi:thiamine biosynthesis lipoprotein
MRGIVDFSFFAMGTRFNAVFPSLEMELEDIIFQRLRDEVYRVELLLSYFNKESDVFKINNRTKNENVDVNVELFSLLEICKRFYDLTGGAFDITMRPLVNFWKQQNSELIDQEMLTEVKKSVGFQKVFLNKDNYTVSFENFDSELDFGGVGKGYALEKVKDILEDYEIECAFISFGESSILALGKHPNGDYWKVGINNYLSPGQSIHSFEIIDGSVSTSSNFTLCDDGGLKENINIINPKTGYPEKVFKAISVASESPTLSEILSTAFLIMEKEKIKLTLNQCDSASVVEILYNSDKPIVNLFNL